MNNTLCKRILFSLMLLIGSIPYLCAMNNGGSLTPSLSVTNNHATDDNLLDAERALDEELAKLAEFLPSQGDSKIDETIKQMAHEYTQEMLEPYYTRTLEQVMAVDVVLEELAANLATNNLIQTKNRAGAVEKIRSLRAPLYVIMNTKLVPLEAPVLYAVIMQINAITNKIIEGLTEGIDTIEPYTIDDHLPKLSATDNIEEALYKALAKNQELLNLLNQKASKLGLRYYNIAWRALHKHLFDPWQHMHMTEVTLGLAWATITAGLVWYYLGGDTIPCLPARFGRWVRGKIGWPAIVASDQILNDPSSLAHMAIMHNFRVKTQNPPSYFSNLIKAILGTSNYLDPIELEIAHSMSKPMGILGRIENRLEGFISGKFVIGSAILAPTGIKLFETIFPQVMDWAGRKIKEVDQRLMGGACIKNKMETDVVYSYRSKMRFDDMIGCEQQKEIGNRLVTFFKKGPETFQRAGIDLLLKTGILCFGPTRGGKSTFVDAIAGELSEALGDEADLKLWKISYQMIEEKGIQWVLDQARFYAPCIVVIEEIDLLGLQRTENRKLLAQFMTAMNSCLQDNALEKAVIIIATTNKLENIEEAMRTPGRFGHHLYFPYPKFTERKQFIERELNKLACYMPQFNIEKLVRLTEGCSYEKIKLMLNDALFSAKVFGRVLNQQSLEHSLEKIIYGIASEDCKLDIKQKEIIATHLAGEIVITELLGADIKVAKATIRNVSAKIEEQPVFAQFYGEDTKQNPIEYGKVFFCHDHDVISIVSNDDKRKQCMIQLAGQLAETLCLGCNSDYHPKDRQRAYDLACAIVANGLDLKTLPKNLQKSVFEGAYQLLNECEAKARQTLEENRDVLHQIVTTLIEKQTLDSDEIAAIFKQNGIATATEQASQLLEQHA